MKLAVQTTKRGVNVSRKEGQSFEREVLLVGAVHHCSAVIDFPPDFSTRAALARPPAVLVSPADGSERGRMFPPPTAHREHGKRQSQAAGSIICY